MGPLRAAIDPLGPFDSMEIYPKYLRMCTVYSWCRQWVNKCNLEESESQMEESGSVGVRVTGHGEEVEESEEYK